MGVSIPTFTVKYLNDEQVFEEVVARLKSERIYRDDLLFRVVEQEQLDRVHKYGTDRAGFDRPPNDHRGGPQDWWSSVVRYEDALFASTEKELREAVVDSRPEGTVFCALQGIEKPRFVVYNGSHFSPLEEVDPDFAGPSQYVFKFTDRKKDAVASIFRIEEDTPTGRVSASSYYRRFL
jgi:hypothetical protein